MKTEYTSGPWMLIGKQGTSIWAGDAIIASVEGARAFHKIARANAELISAAPELLLSLKICSQIISANRDRIGYAKGSAIDKAVKASEKAIAKAEGGA